LSLNRKNKQPKLNPRKELNWNRK